MIKNRLKTYFGKLIDRIYYIEVKDIKYFNIFY
jgi:hypothetical protein